MANYQATLVLDALTKVSETANLDLRAPQYGATQAFNDYKKDVISNYDEFVNTTIESELQAKKVDYIIRSSESVGSSRAYDLTGANGDSLRDTLTFVTYSREFSIRDSLVRQNKFKAAEQLAKQMINARLDIGAAIETAAVVKLEAFKNTVTKASTSANLGAWDSTNYVLEIANADEDLYWNYLATDMKLLDFNDRYQSIGNPLTNALIGRQMAQGAGNATNLQYQFPGWDFYTSNSVTNLSDYFTTNYVVPAGTIALVDWIPGVNREGLIQHADFDFTAMADPFGIFDKMALACQRKVQNSTASGTGAQSMNGTSQDPVWLYEMSIDVAFFIPTITTYKLVQKYGLLKS